MVYQLIESYGVIGDLHTVALVGMDGSHRLVPHFDSPSIFGAILDEPKGGFFKIASLYEAQHKQMYLPDSNVPDGVGELVDFMPVQASQPWQKDTPDRSRRAGGTEIVTNEMPAVRAPPEIP